MQLSAKLQFDNVISAKEGKSKVIGDGPGTIKAWRVVALAAERLFWEVWVTRAYLHFPVLKDAQLLVGGSYDTVGQLCTP